MFNDNPIGYDFLKKQQYFKMKKLNIISPIFNERV